MRISEGKDKDKTAGNRGHNRITITKDTPLSEILELGSVCRRCGHCCSHGSGFLVRQDHEKIADFLGINVKELKERYLEEDEKFNTRLWRPKLKKKEDKDHLPYGECIFLEKKEGRASCRIDEVKPLQCRTGNCSEQGEELNLWFTLHHFLNENDPESVRQYAAYLRTGGKTLPGFELESLIKDKNKLKKILDYEILR
ncbi:MAG: YkgJ family cysteine cluster protein [Candidatus Woesearchaeota archaeon]